jgi:predicted deacylase
MRRLYQNVWNSMSLPRAAANWLENTCAQWMQKSHSGEVFGWSQLQNPLHKIQVGSGRKTCIVIGGLHGNEVGTVRAMYAIAERFTAQPPPVVMTLVPCVNVDGFKAAVLNPDYLHNGRIGRFTHDSIDLNRHFPTRDFQPRAEWRHGNAYKEHTQVFAGEVPATTPELRSLLNLLGTTKPHLIIALHNRGGDVTSNIIAPAEACGMAFARAANYQWIGPNAWSQLGQTGTFGMYAQEQYIPFIEVETRRRYASDANRVFQGITAALQVLTKVTV